MLLEVDEGDMLGVRGRKGQKGEQIHEDGPLDFAEQLKFQSFLKILKITYLTEPVHLWIIISMMHYIIN
jgi:hypothetical protein